MNFTALLLYPRFSSEQKVARNRWICHNQCPGVNLLWVMLPHSECHACLRTQEPFNHNRIKKHGLRKVKKKKCWEPFLLYPLSNKDAAHTLAFLEAQTGPVCRGGSDEPRGHTGHTAHSSWSRDSCYSSRYPWNTVIHFLHWGWAKSRLGPCHALLDVHDHIISWRTWHFYSVYSMFYVQATYFLCQGCWQPFPHYINLVYWLYLGTNIRKLNFLSQRKNKQYVDRAGAILGAKIACLPEATLMGKMFVLLWLEIHNLKFNKWRNFTYTHVINCLMKTIRGNIIKQNF